MNFEIRSTNFQYENKEVTNVIVNYTGRNNDRSISINGNFTLTIDEYNTDSSIAGLEAKAEQHVLDELQK
uniref:hypothetical protein n=1 Tax=uncultured Allobacillus sp. TaxID=1638025 RepID=UPI0025966D1D|nr:hypothetical protein [uncultured Allobacillus sp.]